MRQIPLVLALPAFLYMGSLVLTDPVAILAFSATVLLALISALLIRLAWRSRWLSQSERPPGNEKSGYI